MLQELQEFSSLASSNRPYSPCNIRTIPSNPLEDSFPGPVEFPHTHALLCALEYSWETLCRPLLSGDLSYELQLLCSPKILSSILDSGSLLGSTSVFPSSAVNWKPSQGNKLGLTSLIFHIPGMTVLCHVIWGLRTTVSSVLSHAFCLSVCSCCCCRCPCYSMLARNRSL